MKRIFGKFLIASAFLFTPQVLFAQINFQGIPLKTTPGLFNFNVPSSGLIITPLPLHCVEAKSESASKIEPAVKTVADQDPPTVKTVDADDDDLPKVKTVVEEDVKEGFAIRCPKFVTSVDSNGQQSPIDVDAILDFIRRHPRETLPVIDLPLDSDGVAQAPTNQNEPNVVREAGIDNPIVAPAGVNGGSRPEIQLAGMGGCNLQTSVTGSAYQVLWLAMLLAPLARFLKRK